MVSESMAPDSNAVACTARWIVPSLEKPVPLFGTRNTGTLAAEDFSKQPWHGDGDLLVHDNGWRLHGHCGLVLIKEDSTPQDNLRW